MKRNKHKPFAGLWLWPVALLVALFCADPAHPAVANDATRSLEKEIMGTDFDDDDAELRALEEEIDRVGPVTPSPFDVMMGNLPASKLVKYAPGKGVNMLTTNLYQRAARHSPFSKLANGLRAGTSHADQYLRGLKGELPSVPSFDVPTSPLASPAPSLDTFGSSSLSLDAEPSFLSSTLPAPPPGIASELSNLQLSPFPAAPPVDLSPPLSVGGLPPPPLTTAAGSGSSSRAPGAHATDSMLLESSVSFMPAAPGLDLPSPGFVPPGIDSLPSANLAEASLQFNNRRKELIQAWKQQVQIAHALQAKLIEHRTYHNNGVEWLRRVQQQLNDWLEHERQKVNAHLTNEQMKIDSVKRNIENLERQQFEAIRKGKLYQAELKRLEYEFQLNQQRQRLNVIATHEALLKQQWQQSFSQKSALEQQTSELQRQMETLAALMSGLQSGPVLNPSALSYVASGASTSPAPSAQSSGTSAASSAGSTGGGASGSAAAPSG